MRSPVLLITSYLLLISFLHDLGEGVFEADGLVEDDAVGVGVGIDDVVAEALELVVVAGLDAGGEPGLHLGVVAHLERVGVDEVAEVAVVGAGVLDAEEAVVVADLGVDGRGHRYPVERAFHLAVGAGQAAARLRVIGGADVGVVACPCSIQSSRLKGISCVPSAGFSGLLSITIVSD